MTYFRTLLDVDSKADNSPVTIADRAVERMQRDEIEAQYPDHGIFGEEYGRVNVVNPHLWVLDPIDGTKSFITGMPTFGTLVAFLENKRPLVGVLEMPALKERWIGVDGQPTTLNAEPCSTSGCRNIEDARLYATSLDMFDGKEKEAFARVSSSASVRRFGGDCYSYGVLSSGHIDVVMESSLEPYDYLALAPIVKGAGGCISDWDGNALSLNSSGQVLATASPELHEQVLKIIAR